MGGAHPGRDLWADGARRRRRTTGSTRMNELSRSHAVFIIIVENSKLEEEAGQSELRQSFKVGKLNLVDLAGSSVRLTGATGVRLEESEEDQPIVVCAWQRDQSPDGAQGGHTSRTETQSSPAYWKIPWAVTARQR